MKPRTMLFFIRAKDQENHDELAGKELITKEFFYWSALFDLISPSLLKERSKNYKYLFRTKK